MKLSLPERLSTVQRLSFYKKSTCVLIWPAVLRLWKKHNLTKSHLLMKGRDLLTKFSSSERKSHLAKASVMIEKCLGPCYDKGWNEEETTPRRERLERPYLHRWILIMESFPVLWLSKRNSSLPRKGKWREVTAPVCIYVLLSQVFWIQWCSVIVCHVSVTFDPNKSAPKIHPLWCNRDLSMVRMYKSQTVTDCL